MEFVKQKHPDPLQRGVVHEHPGEHAFGDDLNPRGGADSCLDARPKAHAPTQGLAEQIGHARGRGARSQAPGLEQKDAVIVRAPGGVQEMQGDGGRFSSTRWGYNDRTSRRPERILNGIKKGINGERASAHLESIPRRAG
jgi:hypothetical protein